MLRVFTLALALLVGPVQEPAPPVAAGQVTFNGHAVPGATVIATRADTRVVTTTNDDGSYQLALGSGTWTVRIEMRGFAAVEREVSVGSDGTPTVWELRLDPADSVAATIVAGSATQPQSATALATVSAEPIVPAAAEATNAAVDGLLVTGSVNNGAASPFAQSPAFGNNRPGRGGFYSGALSVKLGDSAWDSRPFSFSRVEAPRPDYMSSDVTATLAGPFRLPWLSRLRTIFFAGYQRAQSDTTTTAVARVPTVLERAGDFSETRDTNGRPVELRDPSTGERFADDVLPENVISPQARALLAFYPLPNLEGSDRGNYHAPFVDRTIRDGVQVRLTQPVNARNSLTGTVEYLRSRTWTTNLFVFSDRLRRGDLAIGTTWSHRFSQFASLRSTYNFRRSTLDGDPYFANRANVSGEAGIVGNDQHPESWGPPSLAFSTGLAGLSTAPPSTSSSRSHAWGVEITWGRTRHNWNFGGDLRRLLVDSSATENPRGSLLFSGSATGVDFGDFLLGRPQSSALGFDRTGRAFVGWLASGYVTDDWRIAPGLTANVGVRWEYESPLSESNNQLTNLDVTPDFTSASAATGRDVVSPDRLGFQPRLGLSWRPLAGSAFVIRGGYGLYRNTNVYLPIAQLLSEQPPFSTAVNRETTPDAPLTLADPFGAIAGAGPHTFAIDRAFRVGFSETWQLSVQQELPASLTVLATYVGIRGHRLPQAFLPNTYPPGGVNPCPACPLGFVYVTSTGSSAKHAVQLHVRRRLRAGFTASLQYTLAEATDNALAMTTVSATPSVLAQNWQDLDAERAPSNFDQRHLLVAEVQYTTGVGLTGGALLDGVRGALFKGWMFSSQLTTGSGLPVTPRWHVALPETAVAGTVRASVVSATNQKPVGSYLNPDDYAPPPPATWGTAGRNSVRGPATFSFNAAVARSFTLPKRVTLEWRLEATNVLNRVTYGNINVNVGSPQFGRPDRANEMRRIRMSTRVSF